MDIADARLSPGAAAAVTTLYAEHALGLVRLAVVLTGDRGAAEDIVQDAFLGLYRRWDHLADSADGHTIGCVVIESGPGSAVRYRRTFTWRSYQASAQAAAAGKYTVAYQATEQAPGPSAWSAATTWVSPSGSASIVAWSVTVVAPHGGAPARVDHFGVVSHGTFTPLQVSPQVALALPAIAW